MGPASPAPACSRRCVDLRCKLFRKQCVRRVQPGQPDVDVRLQVRHDVLRFGAGHGQHRPKACALCGVFRVLHAVRFA